VLNAITNITSLVVTFFCLYVVASLLSTHHATDPPSYQVDNTFFSVHSFFFIRDSGKFRKELTAPPEGGKPRKGSSEGSAIHIRDATPEEFAKFLWVFYNE
jgi:hypothetical protein